MVNVQEGFEIMKKKFNKAVAQEFKKRLVVTYDIKGDGGGIWQVIFDQGSMQFVEGDKESAPLKFHYDNAETFVGMLKGEIDNIQAFTQGRLSIEGPIPVALKVGEFFKPK